jgi:DNA primase catalytic core
VVTVENQRLREAMITAVEAFAAELPRSAAAVGYLRSRGVDERTAAAAEIGYAPFNGGLPILREAGFDDATLVAAGLATRREDGTVRAFFRHRVVVPIRDTAGFPIAFTARTLSRQAGGEGPPKWLNTRATDLFDKGRALVGAEDLATARTVAVVEGASDKYALDALARHQEVAWQAGAAAIGTAFTAGHLELIADTAPQGNRTGLVFLFDGDGGGHKPMARAWTLVVEAAWPGHVWSIVPPPDADPASMIAQDPVRAAAHFRGDLKPLAERLAERLVDRHRHHDGAYFTPEATVDLARFLQPAWNARLNIADLTNAAFAIARAGGDPVAVTTQLAETSLPTRERVDEPTGPRREGTPAPAGPANRAGGNATGREPRSRPSRSGGGADRDEEPAPVPVRPTAAERSHLRSLARQCRDETDSIEAFIDRLRQPGVAVRVRASAGRLSGWAAALLGPVGSGQFWPASALDASLTGPQLHRAAEFTALTGPPPVPSTFVSNPDTFARTAAGQPASGVSARTDAGGRVWVLARPEGDTDPAIAEAAARIAAAAAPTLGAAAAVRLASAALAKTHGRDIEVSVLVALAPPSGPMAIASAGQLQAWSLEQDPQALTPGGAGAGLPCGTVRLASVPNVPGQFAVLPATAVGDTRYSRRWSTAHASEVVDPAAAVGAAVAGPGATGLASAIAGEHTDAAVLAATRTALAADRLTAVFGTAMVCTTQEAGAGNQQGGRRVRLFAPAPERARAEPEPVLPTAAPETPPDRERGTREAAARVRNLFNSATEAPGVLGALGAAVAERRVVAFDYQNEGADQSWRREIEPWGCMRWNGQDYLVGLDRRQGEPRSFRLDRITSEVARVGDPGAFTPPPPEQVAQALSPAASPPRAARRRPPPKPRRTRLAGSR